MQIDLSRILHYDEAELAVSADLEFSADEIGGVVDRVDGPFHVEGLIKNVRDVLTFDGTISGRYTARCSRCNEEVPEEFAAEFHETILKQADDGLEDGILVENDRIDINDAILSNIILHLPMRHLCSETCKGLCPHCGQNLNIEPCGCASAQVDDRLAVLKSLLSQDSKKD